MRINATGKTVEEESCTMEGNAKKADLEFVSFGPLRVMNPPYIVLDKINSVHVPH